MRVPFNEIGGIEVVDPGLKSVRKLVLRSGGKNRVVIQQLLLPNREAFDHIFEILVSFCGSGVE